MKQSFITLLFCALLSPLSGWAQTVAQSALFGQRRAPITLVQQSTRPVPRRLPSAESPLTLQANLVSRNGKSNGATVSLTLPGDGSMTTLSNNSYFANNVCGVWVDGQYYFTQCEEFWGTLYANFDAYHATTWERTLHINSGLTWADVATDLTLDQKTGAVYGCFCTTEHNGTYELGTLDLTTGRATHIAPLEQKLLTLSARDGRLFGITDAAELCEINPTDGTLTSIGSTGVSVDGNAYQSATADPAGHHLYWAAVQADGSTALFAINLANGEAEHLMNFAQREHFVGLYIAGEEEPLVLGDNPDPIDPTTHENSFFEGFEDCDGNYYHEWLPKGWEDRSALGHKGLTPETWTSHQNLTWQIGSIKDGTGHPAYAGDYCAFINVSTAWGSQSNEAQDEWLVTPAVRVKKGEYLYFQLSYSPGWTRWNRQAWDYSGENNTLEVHISTDGGENWTRLWTCMEDARRYSDAELEEDRTTVPHPYRPFYVDLQSYTDQEVRIAFRYVGIGGYSMALDNVIVGLPIPVAHYSLPDGLYRQALSPRMEYPAEPRIWMPAETPVVWRQQAENAQTFAWQYTSADGSSVSTNTPNLTTPAYAAGQVVETPSLTVTFGENSSKAFADDIRLMQVGGPLSGPDTQGEESEYGISNYNLGDPTAYVGFNRTFGFDADSYDKWCGLAGRLIYTVVPVAVVSVYSQPLRPYWLTEVYANAKVEQIDPDTEITLELWCPDETNSYLSDMIGTASITPTEIESLYPDDEANSSWSVIRFDLSQKPVLVDRPLYVMIGGFNLNYDAVYFPGISTANPDNKARSYMGVIDYNDDPEGALKFYDVNSYSLGATASRHLAGFLFGLKTSYETPEAISQVAGDAPERSNLCTDLQGRRLNSRPAHGLYIQNGHITLAH